MTAAPDSITINNLSGDWVMNKGLSDDFDPILSLQGVSWFLRKGISFATVTLRINHYTSPAPDSDSPPIASHDVVPKEHGKDGKEHIDISQTVTGGLQGTTEIRTLDGEKRSHKDHIFGSVEGRTKWLTLDEIEDDFLRQGWNDEMKEGKGLISSWVKSLDRDWEVHQIWGMATVNGQRFYVRRITCETPAKKMMARLVYDYIPPTTPASTD